MGGGFISIAYDGANLVANVRWIGLRVYHVEKFAIVNINISPLTRPPTQYENDKRNFVSSDQVQVQVQG